MGVLVGSAIAAAGLIGSFFIVSRGITLRDLGIAVAEKREPMALHARIHNPGAPQATSPVPPITPKLLPAPGPTIAPASAPATAAPLGAAAGSPQATGTAAAPEATPQPLAAAPEPGAATKDLGDLDSEHMDSAQKSKARREKLRAARARRAKSRGDKLDSAASDGADEAPPAANAAFLQTLQKSAEQGAPAPANPAPVAAAEPAPPPRAAPPPAPIAGPPGLAAAIQKAVGPETPAAAPQPAAVAAPAPAAPARPVTGVPEAPSLGAVRSALAAQLSQAKACIQGQDEPSRASLTFSSDGKVVSVSVSGPAAGTPAEECIKGALQRATVSPFSKPTFVVGLTLRP